MDGFINSIGSAVYGVFTSLGGYRAFTMLFGNDGDQLQRAGWAGLVLMIVVLSSVLGVFAKKKSEVAGK